MAFSTAAVALWTILSSRAATASGRCRPSGLGMYTRRDGSARLCSPMNPLMQISEFSLKVCFVGRPGQTINPRGGVAFDGEERHPQAVDADVVEEGSELLLLPLRGLPYAFQRL